MKQLFLLFAFFCCAMVTHARVWHVTTTGTGTNGSTWATAVDLQYALGIAAANDEIWIEAGTYKPTSGTDRTISFHIPSGVKVYGGFIGTETALNQRVFTTIGNDISGFEGIGNGTILSGDIATIGNINDNSHHIVSFNSPTAATLLDGCIIQDGLADTNTDFQGITGGNKYGGGIFIQGSGNFITISHCQIQLNGATERGAGIYLNPNATVSMNHCLINNNTQTITGGFGGGLANYAGNLTATYCLFKNNNGKNSAGTYNYYGTNSYTKCLFQANTANIGAATYNDNSNLSFNECIFTQNNATISAGGAIQNVSGSVFNMINCVLYNNTASTGGKNINSNGAMNLTNCTIFNTGSNSVNYLGTNSSVTNCIIRGGESAFSANPANVTVTYSNIQGGFTGAGNIDSNPLFLATIDADGADNIWGTADDGLQIPSCSQSYNTGTNTGAPMIDLVGTTRPQVSATDMGAYEQTNITTAATRLYVKANANATGANNGTSWNDAFTDLQTALNYGCFNPNAEIWVAAGTYKPTNTTNRSISFVLPNGVKVYGGFAGTETLLSQRPTNVIGGGVNATILSGDIGIIGNNSDNTNNIVRMQGNGSTELNGFTIELANFSSGDRGAVIAKAGGGGFVRNCVLRNNTGYAFSAFHYLGGAVGGFENCVIYNNDSPYSAAGIDANTNITLTNCIFANNTTTNEASDLQFITNFSLLTNCTFYGGTGGSSSILVQVATAVPTMVNCIVWGNQSNSYELRTGVFLSTNYCNSRNGATGPGTWSNSNGVSSNPLFVNTTDLDGADNIWGTADDGLQLACGSSSRNSGNNANATSTDITGKTRPQETTADHGAYESTFAATTSRLYVNAGATGANNGTSWNDAFTDLQSALKYPCLAPNAEIWVAAGLYRPTTGTDRAISFVIPNGVRVYGGFVGNEANLSQRPPQAIGGNGTTFLSGDINTLANATDNTYQVVVFAGINSPTLLDGFSIIHGNANGSTHELRNGGGVQVTDNGANVSITHCTIALNSAKFTAGVSTSSTSSLMMDKCIVQFNKSESGTGGVSLAGSNSVVTNSVFSSNEGTEGVGALTFENSNNNSRVINCLFVNNIGGETGAVYTEEGTGHRLVNCTFHNNNTTSSFAGAAEQIYSAESGTIELKNCIVTTSIGTMRPLLNSFNNTITVSYSNIQGGFSGTGNIQSNPLFINPDDPDGPDNLWATADDGLNIQGCSPSKNTGTNTDAPATDIVGTARPQEGTVDMGAYETTLNPLVYSRVYVKANASGANNGTSWNDAFTSLQSALGYPCLAPNAEIWVAAGTYRPTQNQFKNSTGVTDRSNTFLIPSGVSVYGGFVGSETDKNQRTLPTAGANGNTILSGDLLGDDAPSFANRTDNALHVVILNNVTEATRLDGFVIKGGYADQNTEIYPSALVGSTNSNGSGLFNNAGGNNLTLAYCTVTDNHALGEGGGMITMALSDGQGRSSLPLVTHCKFENNKAGARGGGISVMNGGGGAPFAAIGITAINTQFIGNEAIDGGGLSLRPIYGTATLLMDGCSVTNNTATGSGGGISLVPQGDAAIPSAVTGTINNTTISGNQIGNTAGNSGAGISGFFLTNTNNTLTITNSLITHNTAASPTSRGGGIGLQTAPQTVGTSALLQLSVSNTIIANNQAAFGGGAHVGAVVSPAALPVTTGVTTTFTECTIRNNTAVGRGGGLVLRSFGNHKNTITRCVFSNNTADNGGAIDIAGETFETTVGTLEGEMNECLFVNNTATTRGGAIRYDDGLGTKTWTFRNCTATGNTAGQHGFFTIENWNSGQTAPTFRNSIAYGNGANSIRLNGGNILFANSLIEGSGGSSAWNTAFGTDNGGNIDANPQFVNSADPDGADNLWRTTDDGLQLTTSSPAFNSGNNTGVSATDIVGVARITGGTVDMGAYEANCMPVIPSVMVAITTGTNPACVGSSLTFTAMATNGGSSPAYQWTRNGTPINGAMNASYTAIVGTDVMNNDQIACILTSNAACASPTTATSTAIVVTTSSLTTRLYVKANAAGANNGTSWNDAFTDLQSALTYACLAPGAEIWVAAGTYKPTTSTDRNASFFLPSSIKLYGGFAGTESNLNQRPTHVIGGGSNATILSGNIGDAGIDTDNSYNVVAAFETATGTVIDGFIIEKGHADISNSVLVNGIYKPSNAGAGILLADKSSNSKPTHLVVRNCWIRSNTSTANGTALRFYASSLTSDIDVVVKECVFSDNNGLQGSAAGLSLDGNNGKVNVAVTNSVFLRQTSGNYSVFYINDGSNSTGMTVKFINNTFTNNTSGNAYNTLGVLNGVQATTSFVFRNNIMWGNNYDQAYNNIQMVRNSSSNASVTVTNNLIEDGYSGGGTSANNLDANPLFTNAADPDGADNIWGTADDGLMVQSCSPSTNTGTSTGAPAVDITGVTRPQGAQVDMGAYEYQGTFGAIAPAVQVTNSSCQAGCIVGGGNIAAPSTGCPVGSTLQYQLNDGIWSTTLPTYAQTGPAQIIKTRCVCNADPSQTSPESSVTTVPGTVPTLVLPANGSAVVTNPALAIPPVMLPVVNDCNGNPIIPSSPVITNNPSPLTCEGTRTYTYTYVCGGSTATWSFVYTVVDNIPPSITCPANIAACESQTITYVLPVGTDNCLGAVTTQIAGLPTGSIFPVGITTNTFRVTASNGQTAECSFTVTVQGKPTITLSTLQQTLNEGNNPVLCDTDATSVNSLQFTVSGLCVSGSPVWRVQVGSGAWSTWSATAPVSQPSNNQPHRYQAACDGNCASTYSGVIELTINNRATVPQNVSLLVDGVTVAVGESKEVCSLVTIPLTFNANCAAGEVTLYSVDGGEYSSGVPTGLVDNQYHNYRVRCRKSDGTPSCVESESGVMRLKLVTIPSAPTVSLSSTSSCDATAIFSGQSSCGSLRTVWYNASTNVALPNLPSIVPSVTTSYYARCQTENGCVSEKSNVVTFTLTPTQVAPVITASQEIVCTGTTVRISANCPAGSQTFWNTGVTTPSFEVSFNNVTKQTYWAKCIFAGGCQSSESVRKDIYWNAFVVTLINVGESKSSVKVNDRSAWSSQFITRDGGPELEQSTQQNPTLYFVENANKVAPRYWTINADACGLGTDGSLTFDMLATPEMGVIRSFNTHENNAPYFMYANREGWTELYAQNHPAYGFYQDNDAGGNAYDAGLPKGLYKLGVRYWDMKGWGSIYPSTRKPQGNVLAYQEYWFRIQSKDGVGVGAARVAGEQMANDLPPNVFAQVMPNLVSTVLRLQVQGGKGQEVQTTLVDAAGRELLQRKFVPETNTHQEEFEVSELPTGMYFLKVSSADKQASLKVIKIK